MASRGTASKKQNILCSSAVQRDGHTSSYPVFSILTPLLKSCKWQPLYDKPSLGWRRGCSLRAGMAVAAYQSKFYQNNHIRQSWPILFASRQSQVFLLGILKRRCWLEFNHLLLLTAPLIQFYTVLSQKVSCIYQLGAIMNYQNNENYLQLT